MTGSTREQQVVVIIINPFLNITPIKELNANQSVSH